MAMIKNHLRKRILEATASVKIPDGWTHFCLDKDRNVALKLPISLWKTAQSNAEVDRVLEMKPDGVLKAVSYSVSDESLTFALDVQSFVSWTLLDSKKTQQPAKMEQPKKHLIVDFSSPNIAKPFHMGHLRSTIVGQFVANALGRCHNITRINYLGDWGTQFGFVQKGLERMKFSDEEFQCDPIGTLYKAYVLSYNTPNMLEEAKNLFLRLENGDETYMKDWQKIKTATFEHLKKTYDTLGIRFDEYGCESDYRMNRIQHVIEDLVRRGLARMDGQQLMIDFGKTKIPLLRESKTTLYITRDIAAALDRIDRYQCDRIVYVVDKSQSQHFGVLDDIISKLGYIGMVQFCPFGRITGMSTRKGTSVFLSDILEESVEKMAVQQAKSKNTRAADDETTRVLGLTGLQTYILKHGRMRDFNFDWNQALQSTGDSGVKMQYTHSRLNSLEKRFNFDPASVEEVEKTALGDPSALPLVFEIARTDDVIESATSRLEPSLLVAHVFKLCNATSRALKHLQVKDQEDSVAKQRLLLFHKARLKIAHCMKVLGLNPLNKM